MSLNPTHKLGGLDCATVPAGSFALPDGMIWMNLAAPDGHTHRVAVFTSSLTEVKPPLPPEPPVASFVVAGSHMLNRRDDQGIDWWDYGNRCWLTWAQVCELGTPVRLVPAPEPVALPWVGPGEYLAVESPAARTIRVTADDRDTLCTPDVAREMARALNTAADQAEATS